MWDQNLLKSFGGKKIQVDDGCNDDNYVPLYGSLKWS